MTIISLIGVFFLNLECGSKEGYDVDQELLLFRLAFHNSFHFKFNRNELVFIGSLPCVRPMGRHWRFMGDEGTVSGFKKLPERRHEGKKLTTTVYTRKRQSSNALSWSSKIT